MLRPVAMETIRLVRLGQHRPRDGDDEQQTCQNRLKENPGDCLSAPC